MATLTSNAPANARSLADLAGCLDLRRTPRGRAKRLGDELADVTAAAIEHRSVDLQLDPLGREWEPLKARTVERKAAAGLDTRINIETHTMLDLAQVRGDVTVEGDKLVMRAGLDDETRAKVGYAEEGGPNRPARPFYDLGADGEEAVDGLIEGVLGEAVR